MSKVQVFVEPDDIKQGKMFWGNMPLPANCKLIGTVTKGNGDLGAAIMCQNEIINDHMYILQGNAGTLKNLKQQFK